MIYHTSDPHLGHANIIKYCNRPFIDVHEMNRTIIKNINDRVQPFDTLRILGDFAFGPRPAITGFLKKIKCQNVELIKGNHDRSIQVMKECGFKVVVNNLIDEYIVDGKTYKVRMQHHPPTSTNIMGDYGAHYVLCGHVHQNWDRKNNVINVGVDVCDFQPLTFEELLNRQPVPIPVQTYREDSGNK